jgi:hypothetical protein
MARARATYVIFAPLRVFLEFEADHDHYYLADRGDKDDQLFYYEKRGSPGGCGSTCATSASSSRAGMCSTASTSKASYSERNENRFNVHEGMFVAGRLSFRW